MTRIHIIEIIGATLLISSVGLVIFFMPRHRTEPMPPSADSVQLPPLTSEVKAQLAASKGANVLISYTDTGFEPAQIRIKKGDTVRFTNSSSGDLWVASTNENGDRYPAGAQSPCNSQSALDSCRALKPMEFWEFTFDRLGTWSFHNNGNTARSGTIVVTVD